MWISSISCHGLPDFVSGCPLGVWLCGLPFGMTAASMRRFLLQPLQAPVHELLAEVPVPDEVARAPVPRIDVTAAKRRAGLLDQHGAPGSAHHPIAEGAAQQCQAGEDQHPSDDGAHPTHTASPTGPAKTTAICSGSR